MHVSITRQNRNWFYLFFSNFLGVFNDNFLKHCIIFIAIGWTMPAWLTQSQLISLVAAALVVPYLLFSPLAGRWAIRYSKQSIWRLFKLLELPIMLLASIAFIVESVSLAVFAVFLMGTQSCMYSPAKYGLIRDVGGAEGVSFGSGIFETMAFLGILIGSVVAPFLSDHYQKWIVVVIFLGIAALGYWITVMLKVGELPEEKTEKGTINPLKFLSDSFRYAKQHSYINSAVFGSSVFWMIGGMIQMNVVIHCSKTLQVSNSISGIVLCCAAIGIALGCTVAGLVSKQKVLPGLIPIGLIGMLVFLTGLIVLPQTVVVTILLVFGLAFMGGFLEVPSMALVQHAKLGRKLGDMIAYLNLVNFIFVLIGTGLFSLTTALTGDNSLMVFGVIALVCLGTLLFFLIRHPEFFNGKASPE